MKKPYKRTYKKKAKAPSVSKNVKKYVKKALTKDKDTYIIDDSAIESVAGSLSVWWMDTFMYRNARINAIVGNLDDKIMSLGLSVRYVLNSNNTSQITSTMVRLLVLETKTSFDTDYRSGTNMFEVNAPGTTTTGNLNYAGSTRDLVSRINTDKYKVLYDKIVKLGPATGTAATPTTYYSSAHGRIWVPYRKMIYYDEANAAFPQKGHLAFVALPIETANDPSVGTNIEISAVGSWFIKH